MRQNKNYLANLNSYFPDLCVVGHATFWRNVQFSGGNTTLQLQFFLHCNANCLSSKYKSDKTIGGRSGIVSFIQKELSKIDGLELSTEISHIQIIQKSKPKKGYYRNSTFFIIHSQLSRSFTARRFTSRDPTRV